MTAVAARARGPIPWRGIVQQAVLQLRLLLRSPESLLVTLGLPAGVLALFGTIEVLPTGDGDHDTFLVAGSLAIAVMATGLVAAAIQTAFERQYGVLKLLGATPLPRWGFVLAKAMAVLAMVVVQATVLLGLGLVVLGWSPVGGLGAVGWPALVGVLVVGAVAFTALGQALAGALPAMVTLAVANALFVVLLAVGGLAFEAEQLPTAVAAVGASSPAGLLGTATRATLDPAAGGLVRALTGLAGWALFALVVAARTFRWEPAEG